MKIATIDFETMPIEPRPLYPPHPVGLALHADGAPRYLSWGHAGGSNTSSEGDAKEALWRLWSDPSVSLLFHHAKFDVAVAVERWGFPMLPWHRIHDSMFMAFLMDPHSRSAGLKELAVDLLGMPPEEQDAVALWVQAHKRELEERYPQHGKVQKGKEGKWIFAVPAWLVGPYAIGDVVRTGRLAHFLMPKIEALGMMGAYDRERQLLPILMENEREGIRVNLGQLEEDVAHYRVAFNTAEDALRRRLQASGLNFDSDADVADVLIKRGVVPASEFQLTSSGQYSMSKENLLPEMFTDREVASVLGYRNRLQTCLSMFMEPWLAQAMQYGGRITTNWNQTRSYGQGGTRTGRPSTNNHNFLNISKSFDGRDDQYRHPTVIDVPPLPLCREYVEPDEGEVFMHRDFSGQELRVFAHAEQGDLHQKYLEDPALDPHAFVGAQLMQVAKREIERTRVKTLNFQSIYGGGVPALQRKLRCTAQEAKLLKQFHDQALPGRRILNEEITRIVRRGEPIRTWGGRLYFPEPAGADGRDKIYKLINYYVQGSAADLTKQALIDWHGHPDRQARFLVTVYDEINVSAAPDVADRQMKLLKQMMEKPRLTVPMLSDGKWGRAWGKLEKCA